MTIASGREARLDADALSRLRLFEGAELPSIQSQLERCTLRRVETGTVLMSPDHAPGEVYVVLSGSLTVHLDSSDSDVIAVLGHGECAGELSIMDQQPPSAWVKAAEPTQLLVIEESIMWELVNRSHSVALNLLHMLARRVRHDNETITTSTREQARFQREATVDSLTGLRNRRWLDETFARELERCQRGGDPVCVVMADVDHFKRYNDELGHQAGDTALCAVADELNTNIRPNDLLARYGGEEFSLLLPDTNTETAAEVADRLRRAVASRSIEGPDGETLRPVTLSLGIALARAGESLDGLIQRADEALYTAKQEGRDRVHIA